MATYLSAQLSIQLPLHVNESPKRVPKLQLSGPLTGTHVSQINNVKYYQQKLSEVSIIVQFLFKLAVRVLPVPFALPVENVV